MVKSRKNLISAVLFILGVVSLIFTTNDRLWCILISLVCFVFSELVKYGK